MSAYRTIYKYLLPAQVCELSIPVGGIVLLVSTDPATKAPALWIEHELSGEVEVRTFIVVGTGGYIEADAKHLGSMNADPFVWHVYERPSGKGSGA